MIISCKNTPQLRIPHNYLSQYLYILESSSSSGVPREARHPASAYYYFSELLLFYKNLIIFIKMFDIGHNLPQETYSQHD